MDHINHSAEDGSYNSECPTCTSNKKWYVALGDGTFVECDGRPYVFYATSEVIKVINDVYGKTPNCESEDADALYITHIHIKDLINQSHWDDHTPVTERSTPDRINS